MSLVGNPVEVPSGTGDVAAVEAHKTLRLVGYSISESAGTPSSAEVAVRHGTADTDPLLVANINLAADGFGFEQFSPGIHCPNGIFIDRLSGTTVLVLYVCKA